MPLFKVNEKHKKFKGDSLVLFPEVSASTRGERELKAAGIKCRLVAPPPQLRLGCDLALEVCIEKWADIQNIFIKQQIPYSRVIDIT